jgi:hypothetical protein
MADELGLASALLVCREPLIPFYHQLGRRSFGGTIIGEQPGGPVTCTANRGMVRSLREAAPRDGAIDLWGCPGARRPARLERLGSAAARVVGQPRQQAPERAARHRAVRLPRLPVQDQPVCVPGVAVGPDPDRQQHELVRDDRQPARRDGAVVDPLTVRPDNPRPPPGRVRRANRPGPPACTATVATCRSGAPAARHSATLARPAPADRRRCAVRRR